MRQDLGFTLIEQLIVIAIIAILALIAVPNFLGAQTRAKVSRCKADMRSLATGLEAYAVDWSAYPPYGRIQQNNVNIEYPATVNNMYDKMCFVGRGLTTPVAYIPTIFSDPFAAGYAGPPSAPTLIREYEYLYIRQHLANFPNPAPAWTATLLPAWGEWRMVGSGPDLDRGLDIKNNLVYDPTNGTASDGDIVRCQKYAEQIPSTMQ